jgi:hypothetical protein
MADTQKPTKPEDDKKAREHVGKPGETAELEEELDDVSGGGNYNCGCGL